ncbi:MAG: CoA-binding protein [Deltaproteobacteria bacterium]|nr:CoA-binding protein [Deltaproteobacteria bacterium]
MFDRESQFRALFHPGAVAFIGASNKPRKWGSIILNNMVVGGYSGRIYPVNPAEAEIQGFKAYAGIVDIPEIPDLAVIVVPPAAVPGAVDACCAKGVKAGVVITAGFAEVGPDGAKLQEEMVRKARLGGMILVGPNCNGIMRPPANLYIAMPPVFPPPGKLAVVAQSGNVATSIARRIMKAGFGCSCFISSGNEADLHCEDYFSFLADDPETEVILSYVEGFRDGRRFFDKVREVSKKKPVVMLKSGSTEAGAKAAASHTASLAGSDLAFEGVCAQAGVIRAMDMDEMVTIATGIIGQPLPRGKRIGIVTAGGGWGVLAADACVKMGLDVANLPDDTLAELDSFLPAWWNRGNPVDLVAGLKQEDLGTSLEVLLRCPVIDGVIVLGIMPALPFEPMPRVLTQEYIDRRIASMIKVIVEIYDQFTEMARRYGKPVIVSSEMPFSVGDFESRLSIALGGRGCACYPAPEDAALVMAGLHRYARYVHGDDMRG